LTSGYLAETFLSYDPVFYLCGAALVLSFIFGTLSQIYEKKRSHRLKAFEDISIRQRNPQEKSQTEIPS
jgi:inosine/xanthosine triphosphate pyrophosphatase family protein